MRACNVPFELAGGSHVPALTDCLISLNQREDAAKELTRVIEAAADPRDFVHDPERHEVVVKHLNQFLAYDGFELHRQGSGIRLVEAGRSTPVLERLSATVETISFDTVKRDIDRALSSLREDPEDAVTAACATVESVCRSILIELNQPLPEKKDLSGLYRAVRKHLGLNPGDIAVDAAIAADVRDILSGLITVMNGIGALRTHGGDAHGRERGYARIDSRIASLAVHASSTVALFLIETWQRKYAQQPLKRHDGS
jgi:hypothetical protein